jgi:hypothetical protein
MSQHSKSITRRTMLTNTAIAAAIAPSPLAALAFSDPDPILAAIAEHEASVIAFSVAVHHGSQMDELLPSHKTRTHCHASGAEFFSDDDPRWLAATKATHEASEAMDVAAMNVLAVEPTTLEGIAALLAYSARDDIAEMVPCSLLDEDESEKRMGRDWTIYVLRNASEAIARIVAEGRSS